MDSSKNLDLRKINQEIIAAFKRKNALKKENAVYVENLGLNYPMKIQYYLVEEFVRNGFMNVLEDGKVYFDEKKYITEKNKIQRIYIGLMIFPIILGILLIVI